jgi:hypothetical protein
MPASGVRSEWAAWAVNARSCATRRARRWPSASIAACTGASSWRSAGPSVAPLSSGSWPASRCDSRCSGASSRRSRRRSHRWPARPIATGGQHGAPGDLDLGLVALGAGLRDVQHAPVVAERQAIDTPGRQLAESPASPAGAALAPARGRTLHHARLGIDDLPREAFAFAVQRRERRDRRPVDRRRAAAREQRAQHLGGGFERVVEQFVDLVAHRQPDRAGQADAEHDRPGEQRARHATAHRREVVAGHVKAAATR